ncbi:hypothetical protein, partial [Nostoc sp. UCD121]|uniref:hypothetical protein n=1 Tax=Nostoc sp. UCD121 TaxID=2681305 RepID=UPI001C8A34CE
PCTFVRFIDFNHYLYKGFSLNQQALSKICFYQVKNQFQMQSLSPATYPQEYEYIEGGGFRDT